MDDTTILATIGTQAEAIQLVQNHVNEVMKRTQKMEK